MDHFKARTTLRRDTAAYRSALAEIRVARRPLTRAKAILNRHARAAVAAPRKTGSRPRPTTTDVWVLRQSRMGINGGCGNPLTAEEHAMLAEMHRKAAAGTVSRKDLVATAKSLGIPAPAGASVQDLPPQPDLSDVQALRVRLLRRDDWLDPRLHRALAQLGAEAAVGRLTWQGFDAAAALLLDAKRLPAVLPTAWRKAEAAAAKA